MLWLWRLHDHLLCPVHCLDRVFGEHCFAPAIGATALGLLIRLKMTNGQLPQNRTDPHHYHEALQNWYFYPSLKKVTKDSTSATISDGSLKTAVSNLLRLELTGILLTLGRSVFYFRFSKP